MAPGARISQGSAPGPCSRMHVVTVCQTDRDGWTGSRTLLSGLSSPELLHGSGRPLHLGSQWVAGGLPASSYTPCAPGVMSNSPREWQLLSCLLDKETKVQKCEIIRRVRTRVWQERDPHLEGTIEGGTNTFSRRDPKKI